MNPILPSDMEAIAEVQNHAETSLLELPNVVGVAIGTKSKADRETGEPCLTALVAAKLDKALLSDAELVPKKVDKVSTDVVEVGHIFAGDQPVHGRYA